MRSIALITGASRGLGAALAEQLSMDGWTVVLDGRDADALRTASEKLEGPTVLVPGDVGDAEHRRALAREVDILGGLDLLVNNAGTLGPAPLPALADLDLDDLARTLAINAVAPVAVFQAVRHALVGRMGSVVNVTSDASVEAYEGWGAYGASKSALDRLSAVLAVENPDLHVWAVDPGDMRTSMHQAAFPGEDISDRPLPNIAAGAIARLVADRPPSGRIRVSDLLDRI